MKLNYQVFNLEVAYFLVRIRVAKLIDISRLYFDEF